MTKQQLAKQALKQAQLIKEADIRSVLDNVLQGTKIVGTGLGAAAAGFQLAKMIEDAKVRSAVNNVNIAQIAKKLVTKYPQWDKEEVIKYLTQLKIHVPDIFIDLTAVEDAVRRAILYGGFDPSYLEQLKRTFRRW